MLVFLLQQHAPLSASHLAQARAAATKMTYAVLSLRAALPDRTPDKVCDEDCELGIFLELRLLEQTLNGLQQDSFGLASRRTPFQMHVTEMEALDDCCKGNALKHIRV